MKKSTKLSTLALAALMSAGVMAASPAAHAGGHNGCKSTMKMESNRCKSMPKPDANRCKTAVKENNGCKTSNSCKAAMKEKNNCNGLKQSDFND